MGFGSDTAAVVVLPHEAARGCSDSNGLDTALFGGPRSPRRPADRSCATPGAFGALTGNQSGRSDAATTTEDAREEARARDAGRAATRNARDTTACWERAIIWGGRGGAKSDRQARLA